MAPGIPDHEPGHPCLVTGSGLRGRFRAGRGVPTRTAAITFGEYKV